MYGPGDVIAALDAFELHLLDSEWVSEIWREKFTSCPEDLPDEYSEKFSLLSVTDSIEAMKQSRKIIKKWLESDPASRTSGSAAIASWTVLQEVQHKNLLALIYFYVKKATSNYQNLVLIELGIKASEFYFSLLSIPGSNVYNIFQMALFEACMEVFNVYKYLDKVNGTEARVQKRNKSIDEDECMDDELTPLQQHSVLKNLNQLLLAFQNFIHTFSFKNHMEALKISLIVLADLSRTERHASLEIFIKSNDTNSFVPLARNAYLIMKDLCVDMHGRVSETIRLVLFRIMPNLSLIGGSAIPELAKWSGKEQNVVRSVALWFVKTCVMPLGKAAHQGIKILIQQLSRHMTDRADYRRSATDMLISIISLLPEEVYFPILKWIFREAMADGANHRVVALELISKLIYLKQGSPERSNVADGSISNMTDSSRSHLEPSHSHSNGESSSSHTRNDGECDPSGVSETSVGQVRVISFCKPVEYVPIEFRRMMLAILIDRVRDSAPTVRAKALTALADVVSSRTSPTVHSLVCAVFLDPYKKQPEIDFSARERDFVKWTNFVAALDEVADPDCNKSLIPDGTRIVEKILRRCLEERVNVRRAALSLLAYIFKLNPQWMTKANLKQFGQHCRDPAMQVRKEMVGAVTDLMLHFPAHSQLTQLWVEEVVPQVADRELRVQEHALTVLTKTILANIKPLEKTESSTDTLPWQLLTHIASLKMRSFLVMACRLWRDSRTPELSPARVAAIVSHIGSAQDAPAWVMLASLSEFVDVADPQPIMDHYLNVITLGEGGIGTANLVLITLNNCWHKLGPHSQRNLQKQLFETLKSGSVAPNLVPMVVNTATAMAVVLSGDEPQGKKEVAKWAVETVQECERHLEPCLDSKNADLGNCEACVSNLILLGSLADLHPDQISRNTFELIFSFLMSAKSARHSGLSKLKAVSVLALARLALQDKYIASRLVAGLSTLISNYTDPVLLINVVVAVADIGERFPNLIEPLVPALCLCLKNRHRDVREMTLVITIDLLQEDYLKPRGALIYHLLSLINDPSPRTVSIVKFYFTNCMLPKSQQAVDQLMLVSMFHYNRYYEHPMYKKLEMTEAEEAAFNISGPKMHRKRMAVYRFLLSNLTNVFRMRCFHHISNVILNGVGDKIINVNTLQGEELVLDAFAVLMSKEIRLDGSEGAKKKVDGDEEEEADEPAPRNINREVLANVQKNDICDTIIPICSKIRKVLIKHRKLTSRLYCFVRELVRDYKSEIDHIFHDDKQFGQEILHEINHTTRGQQDKEEKGSSEPNAEVIQAEVRHSIANTTGRQSKRKSDEHENNEPKKRKSGDSLEKESSRDGVIQGEHDLRELIEDLGHGESIITAAQVGHAQNSQLMLKEVRVVINNIDRLNCEQALRNLQQSAGENVSSPASQSEQHLEELHEVMSNLSQLSCEKSSSKEDKSLRTKSGRGRLESLEKAQDCPEKSSKSKEPAEKRTLRDRTERSSNNSQEDKSAQEGGTKVVRKRQNRTAVSTDSEDLEMEIGNTFGPMLMPPPKRVGRPSRRNPLTPTVPPRKPPLFSSTPLIADQRGFDATDISPVVENTCTEDTAE